MKTEDDPRVPALQLLLGDASPMQKRALINAAFGTELLVMLNDGKALRAQVQDAIGVMTDVAARNDGQSPLGKMAQEQISNACNATNITLNRVMAILK